MVVTNNCYSISYDGEKNSIINIPFPSHSFITYIYIYIFLFPVPNLCIYSILFFNSKSNTIKTHSFFFYHSDPFHYFSLYTDANNNNKEETWKLHATNTILFIFLFSIKKIKSKSPHHSFSLINGPAGPKFMFEERKTKTKKKHKKD